MTKRKYHEAGYEQDIYAFQINQTLFLEIVRLSCGCIIEQQMKIVVSPQEWVDITVTDSTECELRKDT